MNIVYTVDNKFVPQLATGICSICENNKEEDVCFYVVSKGITDDNKDALTRYVEKYGKTIEHMTEIFPNKTNVTFAEFVRPDYIKIREWERGTGETIGCGTGCATAVVAGVLTGRLDRKVTVEQIGGPLLIEWMEDTNHLFMTGPSHTVFEAEIDASHIINR